MTSSDGIRLINVGSCLAGDDTSACVCQSAIIEGKFRQRVRAGGISVIWYGGLTDNAAGVKLGFIGSDRTESD